MHRKITRTGPATLTIAIPAKWTKLNYLKPGDEVQIEELNNKILISAEKIKEVEKQVIEYDQLFFRTILERTYASGATEITIKHNEKIPSSAKNIIKEFIGLEIIERQSTKIVLSKILESTTNKTLTIIRRIYLLIKNSFEENPPKFQNLKELLFLIKIKNQENKELEILSSIFEELSSIQRPIFDETYSYIKSIFEQIYLQKYSFSRDKAKKVNQLLSQSEKLFDKYFKREEPIVISKMYYCTKLFETLNKIIISNQPIEKLKKEQNESNKKFTIGVCLKTKANEFWRDYVLKGMQETAEKYSHTKFIYSIPFTYPDIKDQEKILETFIKQKVDAIIVAPNHPTKLEKIFRKAIKLNIKLVIIDTEIDSEIEHKYIGWDNYKGGQLVANYLLTKLKKNSEKILIVEGQTTGNFHERVDGFKDLMSDFEIEVVKGDFMESLAYKETKKYLEKETVDAIFATSNNMVVGILKALKEKNIEVPVCGFDGTDKAKNLVKQGKILCSVDNKPKYLGITAIETVEKILNNKPVSKKLIYDVSLIK